MAFLNESGLSHYDTKLKQYASGLVSSHNISSNSHADIRDLLYIALHGVRKWADVQTIVRHGVAKYIFNIGDQFTCNKSTTTLTWDLIGIDQDVPVTSSANVSGTGITAVDVDYITFLGETGNAGVTTYTYQNNAWKDEDNKGVTLTDYGVTTTGTPAEGDKIIINIPHSITLGLHDESTAIRFDTQEAAFYIDGDVYPSGLVVGTYTFYWNYATGSIVKENCQFTITNPIPIGGQIVINMNGASAPISSCTITTYDEVGGTTVIEDNIAISSGNEGTSLGTINKSSQTTTVNCAQRIYAGSNDWVDSDVRQWLNASGAAGTWWVPTNRFARPNGNNTGFKKDMDADFLDVIGTVKKKTQQNITHEYGLIASEELFFLLSKPEVYGGISRLEDGASSYPYSYYKDNSDLDKPGTSADSNRTKIRGTAASAWWLRTPSINEGSNEAAVASSGVITSASAVSNIGVAPAVVIY